MLQRSDAGLRVRLSLDKALNDLPWEYLYRPDRLDAEGVSGFLLLDPRISLVREDAHPRIVCDAIAGKHRLAFVGALWEKGADEWKVWEEYEKLKDALRPVARFVSPDFKKATDPTAFTVKASQPIAIFHYAGHCDFDQDGRAFLVREMAHSGSLAGADTCYVDDLAASLKPPAHA